MVKSHTQGEYEMLMRYIVVTKVIFSKNSYK